MCLRSGFRWRHPVELWRDMPWDWWRDWLAFDRLDPIGDEREDWRHARLVQAVAAFGGADGATDDYLPKWGDPEDDDFLEAVIAIHERGKRERGED